MSLSNYAIKTEDKEPIKSFFVEEKEKAYISNPVNGWITVFPDEDSYIDIFNLARKLSAETNTLVTVGAIYSSDVSFFQLYENGELLFDYVNDPEEENAPTLIKSGGPEVLKKYFSINKTNEEIKQILTGDYTFEEDRYLDILKMLNLPEFLRNWGFHYISLEKERGQFESLAERDNLPELEFVSPLY